MTQRFQRRSLTAGETQLKRMPRRTGAASVKTNPKTNK